MITIVNTLLNIVDVTAKEKIYWYLPFLVPGIMRTQTFRKRYYQLSGFDAFSVFLMAPPKIILRLIGKILPEFRVDGAVEGIEMLLPLRVADIIYAVFPVGQFADLHKIMPGHVFTSYRWRAPAGGRPLCHKPQVCAKGIFRSQTARPLIS